VTKEREREIKRKRYKRRIQEKGKFSLGESSRGRLE